MKKTDPTLHLFARPQDVDGRAPFHVDLLRECEPAGDYTVEYRRIDALWHDRNERPRNSTEEILVFHSPAEDQLLSVRSYFFDMDWANYCDVFEVYKWAYLEDFLPYCTTPQTDDNK